MTPEQLTAAKVFMVHGPMLLVIVLLAIVFIIVATAKFKIHPFFALLLSAYGVAFAANMPVKYVGGVIASGFGNLMTSIGLVIVCGTVIGTIMERSGAALRMAETVLGVVGIRRSPLAMSIIGYILPVSLSFAIRVMLFCRRYIRRWQKRPGFPLLSWQLHYRLVFTRPMFWYRLLQGR